jgi:hypothetical protein
MSGDTELLEHLHDPFNARDMEAVLATMHPTSCRPTGWRAGLCTDTTASRLLDATMGDDGRTRRGRPL